MQDDSTLSASSSNQDDDDFVHIDEIEMGSSSNNNGLESGWQMNETTSPEQENQINHDDRVYNSIVVSGYNKQRAIALPDSVTHTKSLVQSIPMQQPIGSFDDYMKVQTMYKQNVVVVKCGSSHTFFLTEQNQLYGLGFNRDGRLGVGNAISRRLPTLCVPSTLFDRKITAIVTGNSHSFVVNEDHELFGTGRNTKGQLGTGNTVNLNSFTKVDRHEFAAGIKQVSCGFDFSIFLTMDNQVYGCGVSDYGQLGLGDQADRLVPTLIPTFIDKTVIQIECGHRYTMFLTDQNELYSAGKNYSGQQGHGHTGTILTATKVTTPAICESKIKSIHCGHAHTILLLENNEAMAFGWALYGQCGLGTYAAQIMPTKIPMFSGAHGKKLRDVVCTEYATLFLLENNEIWTVGMNKHGQLGLDTDIEKTHTPAPLTSSILDFKKCVSCSGGSYHLVFVLEDMRSCSVGIDDKLKESMKDIMSESSQFNDTVSFRNDTLLVNKHMIQVRCPVLLQKQKTTEELEEEEEPPRKKMKMSENADMSLDLVQVLDSHDLSLAAIKLLLEFINRDELSEPYRKCEPNHSEITSVLTEIYLWLAQKMCEVTPTNMMERMIALVLKSLINQIDNGTVVEVLMKIESKLLESSNSPELHENLKQKFDPFRQHLIQFLQTDFAKIPKSEGLSKDLLFEILSKKGEYKLLTEESLIIPTTAFAQDMHSLYNLIQKEQNWLESSTDHVILLLDRNRRHIIKAHKSVLSARCDYFKSKFQSGMTDQNANEIAMFFEEEADSDEDEIRLKTIFEFIEYLYTGMMNINSSNAISMLNIWNFYSMPPDDSIPTYCQRLIMKEVNEDNILDMVVTFLKSEVQYPMLHEFYIRTITKHWPHLHKKHTDQELIRMLSLDLYLEINREYLKTTEALAVYM